MNQDILVVIRSAGERTVNACEKLVRAHTEDVQVINERPFISAVKKTFELAEATQKKWTLALDGDVLLNDDAFKTMMTIVSKIMRDTPKVFRIDFPVQDKFRGRAYAGCHLYQSVYARSFLDSNSFVHDEAIKRPESSIVSAFKAKNGLTNRDAKIQPVGRHDFEQFYFHIYNKYANRACKDGSNYEAMLECISEKQANFPEDFDFKIALRALIDNKDSKVMNTDFSKYKTIESILTEFGIKEKNTL